MHPSNGGGGEEGADGPVFRVRLLCRGSGFEAARPRFSSFSFCPPCSKWYPCIKPGGKLRRGKEQAILSNGKTVAQNRPSLTRCPVTLFWCMGLNLTLLIKSGDSAVDTSLKYVVTGISKIACATSAQSKFSSVDSLPYC